MTDTVWIPLAGGALIGLAALLLMLFNGQIAGISGILGSAITSSPRGGGWRLAFLGGLLGGGALMLALQPAAFFDSTEVGWPMVIAAGALVGVGTQMGNGCTSGHGICGVSRLSRRSLSATITFMVTGIATAVLVGTLK